MEDFTELEQRAAYFDGDPVIATKKGVNILLIQGLKLTKPVKRDLAAFMRAL